MAFRNALRVLYGRLSLADIFVQHGAAVVEYGNALQQLCTTQSALKARLTEYEQDARVLASTEPLESFTHTGGLLAELAGAKEWALLREQAQRHVDSPDAAVATDAKRMLALSLASSPETTDKSAAIDLYQSLAQNDSLRTSDIGNLVTLLMEVGRVDEAKVVVLDGIKKSPAKQSDHLLQIGQRIVEATGDRTFRKQMEAAEGERGERG
jgi:hypothetical protein